jgi:hypothetical protein
MRMPRLVSARSDEQSAWMGSLATFASLVVVFIIYSAACYFYSGSKGGVVLNPLKPSYVYYFVYGAAALICVGYFVKGRMPKVPIALTSFLLFMVGVTLWAGSRGLQNEIVSRFFVLRLNYFILIPAILIIFGALPSIKPIVYGVRIVTIFIMVLNAAIIFLPNLFSIRMTPYPGRAGGLIFEPNNCALLVTATIPFMCLGARQMTRYLLYAISLAAILTTFSREGIVYWIVAVGLAEFLPPGGGLRLTRTQAVVLLAMAVVGIAIYPFITLILEGAISLLKPFLNADTIGRLSGRLTGDSASSERVFVAQLGYQEFAKAPIFGHGVGYAGAWSYRVNVHNMVILMMLEYGVFGLALLLWFVLALFAIPRPYGIWAGVLFLVTIPFVHYYFDLPCFGIGMALCWAASRHEGEILRPRAARRVNTRPVRVQARRRIAPGDIAGGDAPSASMPEPGLS